MMTAKPSYDNIKDTFIEGLLNMSEKAKVREDKNGYSVYVRWQGKRHFISTYLGSVSFRDHQRLAQKAADLINSEIDRGIFRPERWKRRAKKLFTVKGYSESWLERIEPSISFATLRDYRNSFKNHINPILGSEYIEDLNKDKLLDLLNKIKRAPKGKKNTIMALHRMLRDAHESGHIPAMPIFPELRGKNAVTKAPIRWIEQTDRIRILEKISMRHRPIFTFIMLTGCRPSEARAFRREDIRQDHILFAVTFGRGEELKEVKGKKVMPFPLTEGLIQLFANTPKNLTPFVFLNPITGRPYTRNLNRIFNRAARKVGLRVSLNEFGRKSFAMQVLEAGLDKSMVSYLLRHQDPRMIDHYAEFQTRPLKGALDKVQGFDGFASHLTRRTGKNDANYD